MATTSSDTGSVDHTVVIPDATDFSLCAIAPLRRDGYEWLFGAKYRIMFEPGVYDINAGSRIPYRIEVRGEERVVLPLEDEGNNFRVLNGSVEDFLLGNVVDESSPLRTLYFKEAHELEPEFESEPWWDNPPLEGLSAVLIFSQDTAILESSGGRFDFGLASDTQTHAMYSPMEECHRSDDPDVITVTLDGGMARFETHRGADFGGLPARAYGEIGGIAFDTSDYLRFAYADDSVEYLVDPVFAVRLEETGSEGECIFYVSVRNNEDADLPSEARFLDCSLQEIRSVSVVDVEIEYSNSG